MPAANHSFYLRNCYLENNLARGKMEIAGTQLDLRKVKVPVYNLATRDDHIAPARSVYLGSKFFGGPVKFVISGSGHIAGVVNPPGQKKYQYWTGNKPAGDDVDKWLAKATEHPGSWWPDWMQWLKNVDGAKIAARHPVRQTQAHRGRARLLRQSARLARNGRPSPVASLLHA